MPISIRPLSDIDLESAEEILKLAFQRSGDWIAELLLNRRIQPDGFFLAERDGEPVGMVGAAIYSNLAYIGMMAVHPASQRRGVGLALMQHLLAWLERKPVSLILLDASPAGQPLYERLGFVACDPVMILQRNDKQPGCQLPRHVQSISLPELDLLAASDQRAFGADRIKVLRTLLDTFPGRGFLLQDGQGEVIGYLFAQRTKIGPWIMEGMEGAEVLLQAALSLPFAEAVSVAVPGENTDAIALLQRYGFEIVRVNRHMARGPGSPVGQRGMVYGQVSLALG